MWQTGQSRVLADAVKEGSFKKAAIIVRRGEISSSLLSQLLQIRIYLLSINQSHTVTIALFDCFHQPLSTPNSALEQLLPLQHLRIH